MLWTFDGKNEQFKLFWKKIYKCSSVSSYAVFEFEFFELVYES